MQQDKEKLDEGIAARQEASGPTIEAGDDGLQDGKEKLDEGIHLLVPRKFALFIIITSSPLGFSSLQLQSSFRPLSLSSNPLDHTDCLLLRFICNAFTVTRRHSPSLNIISPVIRSYYLFILIV
ncbi:hypothetical protein L2E82_48455 [Cichorium intybus]|uniref:Uncharacterized protein n=1 Tax=Cichorium intybus TaxID=13427 RepID=A0ACB8Z2D2_CICIN|nr:hypothetical protein L2E82_48455 [Cichorium intybus]